MAGHAMAEAWRREHERASRLRILKAWAKTLLSVAAPLPVESEMTREALSVQMWRGRDSYVAALIAQRLTNLSTDWTLFEGLRTEKGLATAIDLQGFVADTRLLCERTVALDRDDVWRPFALVVSLEELRGAASRLIAEVENAEGEMSPTA